MLIAIPFKPNVNYCTYFVKISTYFGKITFPQCQIHFYAVFQEGDLLVFEERNTGFPRIRYGAGLVKPGMTDRGKAIALRHPFDLSSE